MKLVLSILRWLLFPFAVLYRAITGLRNHLYNIGIRPSVQFDLPTICIGNLSVGGTGKTPHAEYLVDQLTPTYKVATLSRGYGRKTKGPRVAQIADTAATIGDEPLQFFRKFSPKEVGVAVSEERIIGIPYLLESYPETEAIILDDAFQHRKLRASYYILLTTYDRPFFKDYLLPTGLLREGRAGANRADSIIVSKCPSSLSESAKANYERQIRKYSPNANIYFTHIQYGKPKLLSNHATSPKHWKVVTGIANPQPLFKHLEAQELSFESIEFADHHLYTRSEVERIMNAIKPNEAILLTEKDAVKWESDELKPLWTDKAVYSLPIQIKFLGSESGFMEEIKAHLRGFTGN